jgi:septal ring factor EnvC (AmiA/AmiB activator)
MATMKKGIRIITMLFLLPVWVSFQPVSAQERSKEEKEREISIQEEIDLQKKALREQQKANEELKNELEKSKAEIDEVSIIITDNQTTH